MTLLSTQRGTPKNLTGENIMTYTSPIGGRKISVHRLDNQSLVGVIQGTDTSLPLTGIPQAILSQKNVACLQTFFKGASLIPEKGTSGLYNRISVRGSLKGGGRAAIPFQPGLALGSVVPSDAIRKMEEYANKMGETERYQNLLEDANKRLRELDLKIQSEGTGKEFKDIWKAEKTQINETFIPKVRKALAEVTYEIPFFTNFQAAPRSPIDMSKSRMEVQPRAFDTLNYSSQYIRMSEDESSIHEKMSQTSTSGSVTVGAKVKYGLFSGSGQLSRTWSKGVAERVSEIKRSGKAEAVLVINAMMTTRNVRLFTDIHYDLVALEQILSIMENSKKEEFSRYGISKIEGSEPEICLLTEAVLGGSFTGIITFLNQDESKRHASKKHKENQSTSTISGSVGFGIFGSASIGGSLGSSSQNQTEADSIRNSSNTNVNIEIFTQGALPSFSREVLTQELLRHVDLNPAKFQLSKKDEENIKQLLSNDSKVREGAVIKRQMQMENAQVAVLNTCRGLKSKTEEQAVHSPKSVMEAYDSFSSQMVKDEGCGVPIGFNYTVLTQSQIKGLVGKMKRSSDEHEDKPGTAAIPAAAAQDSAVKSES